MSDVKDFQPLPKQVRTASQQAKQDEIAQYKKLLRYAVGAILPSSIVGLVGIGAAVWAVSSERVTVWAVDRNEVGYERAIKLDGAPLPHAAFISTISDWIQDLRWITADPVYNDRIRQRAVSRLYAEATHKSAIMEQLRAGLPPQTPQQTIIANVVDVEVTPVSVQQIEEIGEDEKPSSRRQWRVEWIEEVQDLSIGADKLDLQRKKWIADVVTYEGEKDIGNFTGVLFEPMSVREVPNASR